MNDNGLKYKGSVGFMPLGYMALIVLALTLAPFTFREPLVYRWLQWGAVDDIIENVILFLPIGFLFRSGRKSTGLPLSYDALIVGFLLSFPVECIQFFIPGRYPTVSDVLMNTAGAWVGGLGYDRVTLHTDERHFVKILTQDLPITVLCYLFIPLLWLNYLTAGTNRDMNLLSFLPSTMAGIILSSLYIHRLKIRRGMKRRGLAVLSVMYAVIASAPILYFNPPFFWGTVVYLVVVTQGQVLQVKRLPEREQRFELPTLQKIFPLFAIYAVLIVAWPYRFDFSSGFRWEVGLDPQRVLWTGHGAFRLVQMAATFSILGYITAEFRTRKGESALRTMGLVVLVVALSTSAGEGLRGFIDGTSAGLLQWMVNTMAGIYGGAMYLNVSPLFGKRM